MNKLEVNIFTAKRMRRETILIEVQVFDQHEQKLNYLLYEPKGPKSFALYEYFGMDEYLHWDRNIDFFDVIDRDCSMETIKDILSITYMDFGCGTIEAHVYDCNLISSPRRLKTIIINPVTDAIESIF